MVALPSRRSITNTVVGFLVKKECETGPYLAVKLGLASLFQVPSNVKELPVGAQERAHRRPYHERQSDQLVGQVVAVAVV